MLLRQQLMAVGKPFQVDSRRIASRFVGSIKVLLGEFAVWLDVFRCLAVSLRGSDYELAICFIRDILAA